MSGHTPGPWVVDDDKRGRTLMVLARDGGMAVIVNDVGRPATPANRTDAHLIAAAPDLLAAAREAAKHPCFDARGEKWTCQLNDGTGLWCASCLARAAIAKAEPR